MSQTSGAPANYKGHFEFDTTTTSTPSSKQRAASFAKRQLRHTLADIRNGGH